MNRKLTLCAAVVLAWLCAGSAAGQTGKKGAVALETIPHARWRFGGELGTRIDRNVEQWLLRMPESNPGLLDMMHRRDRHLPYQDIVPWAGEFAGKYLISAVQACRMSSNPRLKPYIQRFVDALVASQDPSGYLGPFPEARRLMGDCDLWGHYHCMLGLIMWFDDTGDERAYQCAIRAADAICRLYVDGNRRPIESGNANFNLAVLHVMAELAIRTGNPKYATLCARVEEDLARDGDWLRKGEAGVEYWQLPASGPRWEALHILQGFVKRYEQTGEERYRKATLSLWASIRRLDVHPDGAFTTNEGAVGTIYMAGPIETCCSVAWMALTIDVLRLTGDAKAADELELTLWNQALAAQHPSGQWCTYDTPLNGVRAPSYHQINFQYRPGAPELNCCSVNSPRTLGMLSEWAVMRGKDGLVVSFYGPSQIDVPLTASTTVRLAQETAYPIGGLVKLTVTPSRRAKFMLRLRIPAWSAKTTVTLNRQPVGETPKPGTYLGIDRTWAKGDVVALTFDMTPRYQIGAGPERAGRIAIHAGPILLAFDAGLNSIETAALGTIDASKLKLSPLASKASPAPGVYQPMGQWTVTTDAGHTVTLCDFATAGASGPDYAAWLPASHIRPPGAGLLLPAADADGRPSSILFKWNPTGGAESTYDLTVARDREMKQVVAERVGLKESQATLDTGMEADGDYYWTVRTRNAWAATDNQGGPRHLVIRKSASEPFLSVRADGLMLDAPLRDEADALFGKRSVMQAVSPAADRAGKAGGARAFGPESKLRFELPYFPERDYTAMAWACPESLPSGGQQVFSAWCRGGDDPLRIIVVGSEVFARIEGGGFFSTPGAALKQGEWVHLAAVKQGGTLTLYVNGKAAGSTSVPEYVHSQSHEVGIGFNPLYGGGEHFIGKIAGVRFVARALSAAEVVASGR